MNGTLPLLEFAPVKRIQGKKLSLRTLGLCHPKQQEKNLFPMMIDTMPQLFRRHLLISNMISQVKALIIAT